MSRCKCNKCGKFTKEKEALHDGKEKYCGDCALEIMVKKHGRDEQRAYFHLEELQFGNGHGW